MFRGVTKAAAAAIIAIAISIVLALGLSACGSQTLEHAGNAPASQQSVSAAGGKAAPSFSGPTLDGKTVSLDQYRGKPLIVVYMTPT